MQVKARIVVTGGSLASRVRAYDLRKARHGVASGMTKHWRKMMREGVMADGMPLPTSERTGLLLGIGNGTIIDKWKAIDEGDISVSEPYQEGRYQFAVAALQKRGVVYFSLLGGSANKAGSLVGEAAKKLAAKIEGAP